VPIFSKASSSSPQSERRRRFAEDLAVLAALKPPVTEQIHGVMLRWRHSAPRWCSAMEAVARPISARLRSQQFRWDSQPGLEPPPLQVALPVVQGEDGIAAAEPANLRRCAHTSREVPIRLTRRLT